MLAMTLLTTFTRDALKVAERVGVRDRDLRTPTMVLP